MASIVLSSLGSSLGASGTIGKLAGSFLGKSLDARLFSGSTNYNSQGARLRDLSILTSTYGIMIPIVYGTIKTSGNIIWSEELKEKTSTTNTLIRTKGGKINQNHKDYSYFANLAVSVCEGEILDILRIWANEKLLDLTIYKIRIYKGCENQPPDPLIEASEGIGKTPAYRGQAYVVFEDFPLAEFNNHIPNFNFEIKRKLNTENANCLENKISAITIIPGGGEFVYDTITQFKANGTVVGDSFYPSGKQLVINQHTACGKTNSIVSLDQLAQTLPNIKWVSVVINWFATDLEAENCKILPGVEFSANATTSPDEWKVSNYSRKTAIQILSDKGKPIYGGTINDASLVRYLKELKNRDYNVMLSPMIFTNIMDKPWRGRITGSSDSILKFFENSGYKEFILHYAKLCNGIIDALLIGSELVGITKVQDENKNFPGVTNLINLAKGVKSIVHDATKVSYAADWSEYHHTTCGWYHLDDLWSSEYIDFVGIDSYFPLTDGATSEYDIEKIKYGWESGEGYEYCLYGQNKKYIATEYAWKNIKWWWENNHHNPNGLRTSWEPRSKKIWFTEYGFPSVDCCTNQPNVFFDQTSSESNLPKHSKGLIDYKAQRSAIAATEEYWEGSEMIENKFLWCWDARPYPYWPDNKEIWADHSSYQKGHWVIGKLGSAKLSDITAELAPKAMLDPDLVEASSLTESLEGLIIDSKQTIKSILTLLKNTYFFDVIEKDGRLIFEKRITKQPIKIQYSELVEEVSITRNDNRDIPHMIDVNFYNSKDNYRTWNKHSIIEDSKSKQTINMNLPIVLDEAYGQNVANTTLAEIQLESNIFTFSLPPKYSYLSVGDILEIAHQDLKYFLMINAIHLGTNLISNITATIHNPALYQFSSSEHQYKCDTIEPLSKTKFEILDIPYTLEPINQNSVSLLVGACGYGSNWNGAKFYSKSYGSNIEYEICEIDSAATIGHIISEVFEYPPSQIDNMNKILVSLVNGSLECINDELFFSGYNKAVIGDEIIFFKQAKLIAPYKYELSILIRGMYGTEDEITSSKLGKRFVLLDQNLKKIEVPLDSLSIPHTIRAVTFYDSSEKSEAAEITIIGKSLKPYSPVNIEIFGDEIKWTRRSRAISFMPNFKDVPLFEEFEKYQVEGLDENGTTLFIIETEKNEISIPHKPHSVKVRQLSDTFI